MKARLKAFWKRSKWVLIAVAGVVLLVVVFLLRGLFTRRKPDPKPKDGPQPLPAIDERIKEHVAKVEEEATVARIEAKVRADTDREQLERINRVDDGAERRRRLAAMLRRL